MERSNKKLKNQTKHSRSSSKMNQLLNEEAKLATVSEEQDYSGQRTTPTGNDYTKVELS